MNLTFDNITPARRARRTDPQTSKTAARNAERFAASHAGRILEALRQGAATAHRLSDLTGLTVVQIDRRLPELQKAGFARPVVVLGQPLVLAGYRVWECV
jgi:hypothetical protein